VFNVLCTCVKRARAQCSDDARASRRADVLFMFRTRQARRVAVSIFGPVCGEHNHSAGWGETSAVALTARGREDHSREARGAALIF
jgi:hypothetical protein